MAMVGDPLAQARMSDERDRRIREDKERVKRRRREELILGVTEDLLPAALQGLVAHEGNWSRAPELALEMAEATAALIVDKRMKFDGEEV